MSATFSLNLGVASLLKKSLWNPRSTIAMQIPGVRPGVAWDDVDDDFDDTVRLIICI